MWGGLLDSLVPISGSDSGGHTHQAIEKGEAPTECRAAWTELGHIGSGGSVEGASQTLWFPYDSMRKVAYIVGRQHTQQAGGNPGYIIQLPHQIQIQYNTHVVSDQINLTLTTIL
jgi:hypothetical protein